MEKYNASIQSKAHVLSLKFFALLLVMCTGFSEACAHRSVIEVTAGNIDPIPLAVPTFEYESEEEKSYAMALVGIVNNDLKNSNLFKIANPKAYIQTTDSLHKDGPRFGDWRLINVHAVVAARVFLEKKNIRVQMRLWDVVANKQITSTVVTAPRDLWRRAGHRVADKIYEAMIGDTGYFDSRIVYVAETSRNSKRTKRLAVMDQDGQNHQFLSDGRDLVITPRLSPDANELVYMAYDSDHARVYHHSLKTGKGQSLGKFPGMTFAPRFSPDGKNVIFSQSTNGISSIYTINLKSQQTTRLTSTRALDVSPCYSPDGKKVVFNSDRGGAPQLYVMDKDGKNVKRLSFNRGSYSTPVWSPRGDYIAYSRTFDRKFYIGVMRPDGTGDRILASGYLVESPTWSPNGRLITFTREEKSGKTRLCTIDLTGHHERELKTPQDASDPAWSNLL